MPWPVRQLSRVGTDSRGALWRQLFAAERGLRFLLPFHLRRISNLGARVFDISPADAQAFQTGPGISHSIVSVARAFQLFALYHPDAGRRADPFDLVQLDTSAQHRTVLFHAAGGRRLRLHILSDIRTARAGAVAEFRRSPVRGQACRTPALTLSRTRARIRRSARPFRRCDSRTLTGNRPALPGRDRAAPSGAGASQSGCV